MKSALVPPLTTPWSTPAATTTARRELEKANLQLATGKHADVGLVMGGRSDLLVDAHAQEVLLDGLLQDAVISENRLQVIQQSLQTITDDGHALVEALLPLRTGQAQPAVVAGQAKAALTAFTAALNATAAGSFIFGGQNLSEAPFADWFADPPSAARTAVENAFIARFGFPPGDPAAAGITAADMQDFLDNDLAPLFDPPNWNTLWSKATDEPMKTLISLNDVAPVTASANDPAIRKLAMAYVMVAGLGIETLGRAARDVVTDRAIEMINGAIAGINDLRGIIGVQEKRVSDAKDRLELQKGWLEKQIAGMEQVDMHEMAMRVTDLSNKLEASYAITGRLQNLTLLKYL